MPHPKYLVWINLEMTGSQDVENERILELACIITDFDLQEIDTLGPIVLRQSADRMQNMHPWCIKTHGESGLTEKVLKSEMTEEMCEHMMMEFLKKCLKEKKRGYLAGNSVHVDKKFIDRYLPKGWFLWCF